jgi:glycosyltransferase involved in cell wall biosynthesis
LAVNILFVTRLDALIKPGGDTIQLQKTSDALKDLGLKVRFGQAEGEALVWADVVHIFNAQTPEIALPAIRAARLAGKKTVLSTIWWDLGHAQQVAALSKFFHLGCPSPSWLVSLPLYRLTDKLLRRRRYSSIAQALEEADLLLPNSLEEMNCLQREFTNIGTPYFVVMNAVDDEIFHRRLPPRGRGVICCSRIEPGKNQLSLIRAVAGIPNEHLTLVGRGNEDKDYNRRVRNEVRKYGFTWIEDHLSQDELAVILQSHAVHALPSFRESPGLSSLEALASGLNIVISDRRFCPVNTYFDAWLNKNAFMCNPYSKASLQRALQLALHGFHPDGPFPSKFTWRDVGKQTLAAYHEL